MPSRQGLPAYPSLIFISISDPTTVSSQLVVFESARSKRMSIEVPLPSRPVLNVCPLPSSSNPNVSDSKNPKLAVD